MVAKLKLESTIAKTSSTCRLDTSSWMREMCTFTSRAENSAAAGAVVAAEVLSGAAAAVVAEADDNADALEGSTRGRTIDTRTVGLSTVMGSSMPSDDTVASASEDSVTVILSRVSESGRR